MLYNTAYKNGFSAALASGSPADAPPESTRSFGRALNRYGAIFGSLLTACIINNRQAWVCENADRYTSNIFAEPYKQLSYVNGSVDGYVTAMGFDADRPLTRPFPVSAGGSSSKFYSDYYYSSEGQRDCSLYGEPAGRTGRMQAVAGVYAPRPRLRTWTSAGGLRKDLFRGVGDVSPRRLKDLIKRG